MTMTSISIDSSRTKERHQDQQDQHNEDVENQEYDYYYYSPAPARACACARGQSSDPLPGKEIMEQIARAYRDNINPMITGAAAGIIERALRNGMEPATVIEAIMETGMAPRPSPYYLSAVLRNWAENGVVLSKSRGGADIHTTQARPWWMEGVRK